LSPMRMGRIVLVSLTLAGLLLAGGVSAFCVPASQGGMKCCKTAKPCGPGMKQADCCKFTPAAPRHAPVAVETTPASKICRDEMIAAALAVTAGNAFSFAEVSPQASPPLLIARQLSVPLYILNTSLLR
jgi:hypothetical protein